MRAHNPADPAWLRRGFAWRSGLGLLADGAVTLVTLGHYHSSLGLAAANWLVRQRSTLGEA